MTLPEVQFIHHEVSITRDRTTPYCRMPLLRLRCTCGWGNATSTRIDANLMKKAHAEEAKKGL
jgi:hypothetical protein